LPPKVKYTKDEITQAALTLIRREGKEGLTARALGEALGCSSRPIFTAFANMDEVLQEAIKAARARYNEYIEIGLGAEYAFGGVGKMYFRFANDEPRLFELLFMSNVGQQSRRLSFDESSPMKHDPSSHQGATPLGEVLPIIDDNNERIVASIEQGFGFSREVAMQFYQRLWIFTHGLACLCVTGVSQVTEAEALAMMAEVREGLLATMREKKTQ